jgi:hypothetical protein
MGVQVPRSVHPEAPAEDAVRAVAPGSRGGVNVRDVRFWDVTVEISGVVCASIERDSAQQVITAVDFFRGMLRERGTFSQAPIPIKGVEHIELHWRYDRSAAAAKFLSRGVLVATSALITGYCFDSDLVALQLFAASIPHVTGASGKDLASELSERPLMVTAWSPGSTASRNDRLLVTTMKTCLAEAFFVVEARKIGPGL